MTQWNQCSNFILTLLQTFWFTALISFFNFLLNPDKNVAEPRYFWSFTSSGKKSPMRLSRVILLYSKLYHIFQSTSLETLHPREKGRIIKCEGDLHSAENSIFWKLFRLWLDVTVHHLMIFDPSACFIIKGICPYHTICVRASQDWYFSLCNSCCWIYAGLWASNKNFLTVCK